MDARPVERKRVPKTDAEYPNADLSGRKGSETCQPVTLERSTPRKLRPSLAGVAALGQPWRIVDTACAQVAAPDIRSELGRDTARARCNNRRRRNR